jgi:hypothetical protein
MAHSTDSIKVQRYDKRKGQQRVAVWHYEDQKGQGRFISKMTTGALIAKMTTGTAIATKLQRTAMMKDNSMLDGSTAKMTTGALIAVTTTGTASRPALLQPQMSMNTNVEDMLMQLPPLQPETMKTKKHGCIAINAGADKTNNVDKQQWG